MKKPDLRTMKWELRGPETIYAPNGDKVDLFTLHAPPDQSQIISLGVPHGRDDIADFVIRCLRSGQNVLKHLPPGSTFAPDEALPRFARKQ